MDNENIKTAMAVLQEEKKNLLNTIAKGIVNDSSANKKIMEQARIERMREAHRQATVINELCADFEDILKPTTRKPREK